MNSFIKRIFSEENDIIFNSFLKLSRVVTCLISIQSLAFCFRKANAGCQHHDPIIMSMKVI